jgi:hypothetical protein
MLSESLKWNKHVNVVLNKTSKNIGIMAKVRHLLPIEHRRSLYMTLVQPYINYACLVWAGLTRSESIDRVLKIQKKFCRIMTFSEFRTPAKPLFRQLDIMTVYQIYAFQLAQFSYKLINNHFVLNTLFTKPKTNSEIHSHDTRQKLDMHVEYSRTVLRQKTIELQIPLFWNTIPLEIKHSKSLTIFKKRIKSYILLNIIYD